MVTPLLYCLLLTQAPQPASPAQPVPIQNPAEAQKAAPEPTKQPRPIITKVEDNGLLEHEYFGAVIPFAPQGGVDALWIKSGLSLKNKQITYGSWEIKVLRGGRQEKDLQRATDLAKLIPDSLMPQLRVAFQGVADWQLG